MCQDDLKTLLVVFLEMVPHREVVDPEPMVERRLGSRVVLTSKVA